MTPAEMKEFRAARKSSIGASDAWACCFNPLKVYLDKTGQLPEETSDEMEAGLLLEDAVAALYERATGRDVCKSPQAIVRDRVYPWRHASPDRFAMSPPDGCRLLELKTAGDADGWGTPGTDEIPERYILQVQQQMAVLGHAEADVAVLIRLGDFRIYTVRRNQPLIDRLTEIEAELWERIQRREPPAADWSHPDTPYLLKMLHRPDEGVRCELDATCAEILDDYRHNGEMIAQFKQAQDRAQALLIEAMGNASQATLPDGRIIKRKKISVAPRTQDGYEYFNFTVSKPKRVKS